MTRNNFITVTMNPSVDVTLWLDGLHPDEANRVVRESREAGGKGINVSRVLNTFGLESLCLSIAGRDNVREFGNYLSGEGLRYEFLQVEGLVRENLTLRYEDQTVKLNRKGPSVSALMLTAFMGLIKMRMKPGDIVIFGGSLPENVPVHDFVELVLAVKNAGARIALDTDFLTLDDYRLIKPWLIKPNQYELQHIVPEAGDDVDSQMKAARRLVEEGVENVLVSLGSQGLFYAGADKLIRAHVPKVEVKSTVGCGDSTLGGFLVGTAKDLNCEDTVRLAAACGTACAQEDGTMLAGKKQCQDMAEHIETEIVIDEVTESDGKKAAQ